MATAAVACPNCSGTLGLTTWAAGRQMRCPRCKTVFRLGPAPGAVQMGSTTAPAVEPSRTPPHPASTHPAPAASPAEAPSAPRGNRFLVVMAVVGGMLLFIGGTVGLAFLVAGIENKPTPPEPGLATGQPTPTPAPEPTPNPPPNPTPNPTPPNLDPQPMPMPMPMPQPPPLGPNERRLPAELQGQVNAAIERGVTFLRAQEQGGMFQGGDQTHANGSAFLAGLTLLECGVPANDPVVVRVAARAREFARRNGGFKTYEVSVALLFLDRLGDPGDKAAIQSLGLALLGGQMPGGGWFYDCQTQLTPEAQVAFLAALRRAKPESASELILRDGYGRLIHPSGILVAEDKLDAKTLKGIEAGIAKLAAAQGDLKNHPELLQIMCLRATEILPPGGSLPQQLGVAPRVNLPRQHLHLGHGDNSNTQFAALGLWVASRHDVPCERALALLAGRFRLTQGRSGAWAYGGGFQESPTMTCAGLLALAIGHSLRIEEAQPKREDVQIAAAVKYLAEQLATNGDGLAKNLYLVWSLERVGVLFGLDKIGATDWYEWGARRLVASQNGGSWGQGGYLGSTPLHDTCFALLFLKKANLASDLTNKVERVLDFKGLRR
jgi:hypothetical protein